MIDEDVQILNDPRHTAVHEAGHAVIARKLGMVAAHATVIADATSAGYAIVADPYDTLHRWESLGHFRDERSVFVGRIISLMAGAESELEVFGLSQDGVDAGDCREIGMMLHNLTQSDERFDALDARLRKATRMLVRRHRAAIERVAQELQQRKTISGADIDAMVPGPTWPPYDNPFL